MISTKPTLTISPHWLQDTRMIGAEAAVIITCASFSAVALTINISLLIIMKKYTPKSFANFGIVMKFQVLVDIHTNFTAAAVINR